GMGANAAYVAFGRALGWMETPSGSGNYVLYDVHGAGAQRSDPKTGNPSDYPHGYGPQGDVIRIYNYARCVRSNTVQVPTITQWGKLILIMVGIFAIISCLRLETATVSIKKHF
ncbi:hypothetical protein MBAV_004788, partial [Candidatus Magnetobacterium bavaricum]